MPFMGKESGNETRFTPERVALVQEAAIRYYQALSQSGPNERERWH